MELLEIRPETKREARNRPSRSFLRQPSADGARPRRQARQLERPLVEVLAVQPVEDRPAQPSADVAPAGQIESPGEPGYASTYLPATSGVTVDGLQLYLREVGHSRLLTAEEEVQLAQEIEAGREARARLEAGAAEAEVASLMETVDRGEAARQRLINANLRLVVSLARQHLGPGVEFSDLIQEGNLGLLRAVDRFDWRKGNRFSTYALWWIRQATSCAVGERARTIRLPSHMVDTLGRLAKTEQRLAQELGHHPTDAEVCEALGISLGRLADLRQARERPSSLEAPIGEDGDYELADLVEDRTAPTPLSALLADSLRDAVDQALATLDARERRVLSLRYGLEDDQPRTLEEVGRALKITKERVRQLEGRAIRKLRHSSQTRWLVEYAD